MNALELTRQLVAIDSQNPGPMETRITAFIEDWALNRGFATRVIETAPGRTNLIVTLDQGGPGHVALSGHMDTKPLGDAIAQWHTPPFELVVQDGIAYGLGATDMKGGIAAMMLALEALAVGPGDGRGRTSLILTADEEHGSDFGAKALTAGGKLPSPVADVEAVVIGEPGGISQPWEAIYLVSRGISCFTVDIRTQQGHSGLSGLLGPNAIQVAADLVRALGQFRPDIDQPGEVDCAVLVNPGIKIEGGVAFGTWPGRCQVGAEVRLAPGMDQTKFDQALRHVIDTAVDGRATWDLHYAEGSQGWMPAVELTPRSPIAVAAKRAVRQVLNLDLPFGGFPGGTDATYFMGAAGVDTIASLGPGWISAAHGANEKVRVVDLAASVGLYEALVRAFFEDREEAA